MEALVEKVTIGNGMNVLSSYSDCQNKFPERIWQCVAAVFGAHSGIIASV
jgi:hypothetical protein